MNFGGTFPVEIVDKPHATSVSKEPGDKPNFPVILITRAKIPFEINRQGNAGKRRRWVIICCILNTHLVVV